MRISPRYQIALLVLLVGAAFAFHMWRIGEKPLWVDEAEAWRQATTGQAPPTHPPFYFHLLTLTVKLLGEREWALRLPSAAAAALMVAALWWAAGEAGMAAWPRFGAAAFAAASPYLLLVGQQARMYGVLGLWGALFLAALLAWRRRGKIFYLTVAAAAAVAGVYTAHSFWFVFAGGLFLWPWRRRAVLYGAVAWAVVVACYAPLVVVTAGQIRGSGLLDHVSQVNIWLGGKAAVGVLFGFGAGFIFHPFTAVRFAVFGPRELTALTLTAGAAVGPFAFGLAAPGPGRRFNLLLGGALAVGLLFNFLAPSGAEQMPVLYPFFTLVWVAGVLKMTPPWRLIAAAVWAAVAGAAVAKYERAATYPLHEEDWRTAAEFVRARVRPGDVVATRAGPGGPADAEYYGGLRALDTGREGMRFETRALATWVIDETGWGRRVFLFYGDWGNDEEYQALRRLGPRGLGVTITRFGSGLVVFEFARGR